MITMTAPPIERGDGRFKMDLEGKSTDKLPTKEYNSMPIANASTILLIDTADVKFYDQDTEAWL